MSEEKIIRNINENQDSVEIGTAKFGKIKVYFDTGDEEEAKKRVEVAIRVRTYALELTSI